jgi:predicted esterase
MSRLPLPNDFPSSAKLSIIPPSTGSPVNILILLHGLGDTETSFAQLGKNLNLPETACIALRGFSPIPELFTGSDRPSFHWGDDVLFDEGRGEIELDSGFGKGVERLWKDVIQVLMGTCGYKARNILFFGFGQGAMLPLALAVEKRGEEFGGIVSIGGSLPARSKGKSHTPVLVCGGSRSTQITRSAVDTLKAAFGDVEYVKWEKYEDSMPRSREEMLPIMKFFARSLRSRAGVPEGAVEV